MLTSLSTTKTFPLPWRSPSVTIPPATSRDADTTGRNGWLYSLHNVGKLTGAAGSPSPAGRPAVRRELMFAMFGVALIIVVFGVVNTLAVSVLKRTREIGVLRAVGLGTAVEFRCHGVGGPEGGRRPV
jgi:hypothetical protein